MSTDSKLAEQSRRIAACQRVMDLIDAYVERPNAGNRLSIREGLWELAAHEAEQQQAGEAVARVRVTSVTPGRFDEIDVLRPLPQGEHLLFTHPQQPLTEEQMRLERKRIDPMAEDMDAWSFGQGVRFAERALGITKDTK